VSKVKRRIKSCFFIQSIVSVDAVDSRSGGIEPEVTHKNTRIKPILLREVLEAIYDYAFVTSE
jgi:hypothetical protein